MKKISFSFLLLITVIASAQQRYQVTNRLELSNQGCQLTKVCVVLPIPTDNPYQTVGKVRLSTGESLISKNGNAYQHDLRTNGLPLVGQTLSIDHVYDITMYKLFVNFDQFKELYPYDTGSDIYKSYTRDQSPYIDLRNPKVLQIADRLWEEAKGDYLQYARLCYEHVGRNYRYLNPNTGIHAISQIMADGGGDCGNLSSIFVTLLRVKGIPARHIVTQRPLGAAADKNHVWADFYLEKYGWIPVDVNRYLDDPNGDYFGYCLGDGVVVSTGINDLIEYEKGQEYAAQLLQTYYYWYWYSGKENDDLVSLSHTFDGKQLSKMLASPTCQATHRTITVGWDKPDGASGFRIVLKKTNADEVIDTIELAATDNQYTFEGLDPETDYTIEQYALRRIGGIEYHMGCERVFVTTQAVPTSIEPINEEQPAYGVTGAVELRLSGSTDVRIISPTGMVLFSHALNEGNHAVKLHPGIYFVSLSYLGKTEIIRVCVR